MLRKIVMLSFSLFTFHFSFAQLTNAEIEIGSTRFCVICNAGGESVIQTSDSGYAISGYTDDYGYSTQGNSNVYIIKLDKKGNLEWTKTVGGTVGEDGVSIIQTHDKGYAIAGTTLSFGFNLSFAIYIIKLDSSGNLKWTKVVGGNGGEFGASIVQTYDRGYAITGVTGSYGAGGADVYVVKLDSNANLKWTRTIGGAKNEYGNSIIQTNDNGLAITGYTTSYGAGDSDVYVIKLDSVGNLKWTRTIGGVHGDVGNSIIQAKDQGLVIAGSTRSYGTGYYDVYIVKLDSLGNLKWTRTVGGTLDDEGYSIAQAIDGGYAIIGYTGSYVKKSTCTPATNTYFIKLDSNGNLVWTKTIGTGCSQSYSIAHAFDHGFVMIGDDFSIGNYVLFLKSDSNGTFCQYADTNGGITGSGGIAGSGGVEGSGGMDSSGGMVSSGGAAYTICSPYLSVPLIGQGDESIGIYPNPSKGKFTLSLSNISEKCNVEIYNVLGENICQAKLTSDNTLINLNRQSAGVYFYRVVAENGNLVGEGKVVVGK